MIPTDYLYVPIRSDLVQEFYRRRDRWTDVNIAREVERCVEHFLDLTAGDPNCWDSDAYLDEYADDLEVAQRNNKIYGPPHKGYQWKTLFLPNGTQLMMNYNGVYHFAAVKYEQIRYEEETLSPSQLVSKIARGTSRNAWRDLYIQWPKERDWVLADVARHAQTDNRRIRDAIKGDVAETINDYRDAIQGGKHMVDPKEFLPRKPYAEFEGGAVYTAEKDGRFFVITDETSMEGFLSEEDLEGLDLRQVREFKTLEEREAYLKEQFGADSSWDDLKA